MFFVRVCKHFAASRWRFGVLALCGLFCISGAGGSSPAMAADMSAVPAALDDPGNPYLGEYSPLDRWIAAHIRQLSSEEVEAFVKFRQTPESKALRETQPEGWRALRCYRDGAGWLLPQKLQREQEREPDFDESVYAYVNLRYLRAQHQQKLEQWKSGLSEYFAAGVPDEAALEAERKLYQDWAMAMPRIPAWIGSRPPLWMIAVPNGEFLVGGALGLHYVNEGESTPYSFLFYGKFADRVKEPIYRYSPEGQLLQTIWEDLDFGSSWMGIYWPELNSPEFIMSKQEGTYRFHGSNTVAIVKGLPGDGGDSQPQEIVAAYDYDGTPINPNTPFLPERRGTGRPLFRDQIKEAFDTQCAAGKGDPAARSPFEGRPDGPVVAPLEPQPWPVVAYKPANMAPGTIMWGGMPKPFTRVAELDAAHNPYKAQYQPWDQWLHDNANEQNPRQQQRWQDGQAKRKELEEAAKLAGRELDATDRALIRRIENDPGDPWREYVVEVEASGWQVPAVQDFERRWQRLGQRDLRYWDRGNDDGEWQLRSGGDMPAEMLAQYEAATNAIRAERFPVIPDWLVAAPVQQACFLPNGDVITRGAIGAWDPDNSKDYWDRAAMLEKSWYRYGHDGSLLGTLPEESAPWCAFYNMSMLAQYDAEKSAGHMVFDYRGVWLSLAQNSGELYSAWDWNGMPLSLDQPITRPEAWGSWLLWDDLVAIHSAQYSAGLTATHPSADWPCARKSAVRPPPR